MIHFKFVGIKDTHNNYYLGLSGERSLPFGLLVIYLNMKETIFLYKYFIHKYQISINFQIVRLYPPEITTQREVGGSSAKIYCPRYSLDYIMYNRNVIYITGGNELYKP